MSSTGSQDLTSLKSPPELEGVEAGCQTWASNSKTSLREMEEGEPRAPQSKTVVYVTRA